METINTIQIESLQLRSKTSSNVKGEQYVDVLNDGNNICFLLGSHFFKTERGMYSEFILPSKCSELSLSKVSDICARLGNPVKTGKTTYLDIVLDTNDPEERKIVKALKAFTSILQDKLIDALMMFDGQIEKYLNTHCHDRTKESIAKEINIMYLKPHNSKSNIIYLHLKVDKNTKSYDDKGNLLDTDLLCYKPYTISPVVKIDNIRIPRIRNDNSRLNVHLYVMEQVVTEYVNKPRYITNLEE